MLFTKKEKHGHIVYDCIKDIVNKKIIYLDGDNPLDERKDVIEMIENNDNIILMASYGIFSTGINAKNIKNIIFISGYKSKVKVLQSIGRGLRLHKDKQYLNLIDIVDNFSFTDSKNSINFVNHGIKHYKERCKLYEDQGWQYKLVKIKMP